MITKDHQREMRYSINFGCHWQMNVGGDAELVRNQSLWATVEEELVVMMSRRNNKKRGSYLLFFLTDSGMMYIYQKDK